MTKRSTLLLLSFSLIAAATLACSVPQIATRSPTAATPEPPTPTPETPTPTADLTTGWNVYQNEEYGFEVRYPEDFAMDVCYPAAVRGDLVVSFRLVDSKYYSGTNLLDACVIIGVSQDEADLPTCLEPKNALEESLGEQEINSITFHKGSFSEGAVGNVFEEISYRTIHRDGCYEIALFMHSGNIGAYTPGTVSEFNREGVLEKLYQVLSTFRFLE
jgi:hypothetical protein